jgi:hypothetical protein
MNAVDWNQGSVLEARGRIELPIKVLQTFALPLGDRAFANRTVFYNTGFPRITTSSMWLTVPTV